MLRPWDKKVGEGKIKTTIVSRDGTVPEYINRGSKTYRLAHHTVDPSVLLGFTFADANYWAVEKNSASESLTKFRTSPKALPRLSSLARILSATITWRLFWAIISLKMIFRNK